MSAIRPQDLILYAGGDSWQRFGAFTRKTNRLARFGETQLETFARADATPCAHFLGRDGLYHLAQAGVMRPHWVDTNSDGIPDTLTYLGERSCTNSLLQSQALATTWAATNLTATNNTTDVLAPDGTQTATKLVPNATNTFIHRVQQSLTVTSGEFLAKTVWMRAGAYSGVLVFVSDSGGTNGFQIAAELTTGTATLHSASGSAVLTGFGVQSSGNGWYRLLIWGSLGAIATAFISYYASDTGAHAASQTAFAGDGVSGIYGWGGQLERNGTTPLAAPPPQEYVATAAAAVTKAADACIVPVAADVVPITFYAKFLERGATAMVSQGPRVMAFDTGVNPRFMLYQTGGKYAGLLIDPNNAGAVAVAAAAPNYGDLVELVGTYDGLNTVTLTQAINGVPAATVTTGGVVKFGGLWGTSQVGLLCSSASLLNTPGALIRAMAAAGVHTLAECQAVP